MVLFFWTVPKKEPKEKDTRQLGLRLHLRCMNKKPHSHNKEPGWWRCGIKLPLVFDSFILQCFLCGFFAAIIDMLSKTGFWRLMTWVLL